MLFKLISTAETGTFYVGKKSTMNAGEKLQMFKFDPKINQYCLFVEHKMKAKKKR